MTSFFTYCDLNFPVNSFFQTNFLKRHKMFLLLLLFFVFRSTILYVTWRIVSAVVGLSGVVAVKGNQGKAHIYLFFLFFLQQISSWECDDVFTARKLKKHHYHTWDWEALRSVMGTRGRPSLLEEKGQRKHGFLTARFHTSSPVSPHQLRPPKK